MLRTLIYGLAILHLGPGMAFAVLAFGCNGVTPNLGAVCGMGVFRSFALLTAASWLILAMGLAAVHLVRRARGAVAPSTGLRVLALLAVVATGALLGFAWAWLTGSNNGYLAVPAALAAGWLFLANPTACEPTPRSSGAADHSQPDNPRPRRGVHQPASPPGCRQ